MAMIIDGKKVAREREESLSSRIKSLYEEHEINPSLAFLSAGADEASLSYQRSQKKACERIGIVPKTINLDASVQEPEILDTLFNLNEDDTVHAIIVTLPLPKGVDEERILGAIELTKDVDCLNPSNRGRLAFGKSSFLPATPAGITELLKAYEIPFAGKHVVIAGRGKAVGWPLAQILMSKGCDATVTVCHSRSGDLAQYTKKADILVAAIGKARFVDLNLVHENQVVIDAGINAEETASGWKIVGDVDFELISDKVYAITPVPGGVGPMTVAMLLSNVVQAAERRVL
ncbi:bifunctional 5,10-methylenetetrahydrofolate dehydrogenase/5,10-methenyltetrahydrofolate cyclohydrolase [bacterium]|nr:bifunctional 5,10-methylenetetrahydrofolate dehydrogenase/5,10-methenyltetrahydrofolate cyclohydrolase [bacterium]